MSEVNSDVDSKENATSSPTTTTSNKKRKYNAVAVQGIITPGDDNMKANSNMAKSYPYLSREESRVSPERLLAKETPRKRLLDRSNLTRLVS